jgi:hypothetical protein
MKMKNIFLVLGFLAFANASAGEQNIRLKWTAPTEYVNGDLLPADEIDSYQCFSRPYDVTAGWDYLGVVSGGVTEGLFTVEVQPNSVIEAMCKTIATNGKTSVQSISIAIPPNEQQIPNPPEGLQGFLQ